GAEGDRGAGGRGGAGRLSAERAGAGGGDHRAGLHDRGPEDRGLGPAEGAAGGVRGGGGLDPGTDRGLPAGDGGGGSDADAGAGGGDGDSGEVGRPPEHTLKPVRRLRTGLARYSPSGVPARDD